MGHGAYLFTIVGVEMINTVHYKNHIKAKWLPLLLKKNIKTKQKQQTKQTKKKHFMRKHWPLWPSYFNI